MTVAVKTTTKAFKFENSEIICLLGMEMYKNLCYILIGFVNITFCRKVHISVKQSLLRQPGIFVNCRPVAESGERHSALLCRGCTGDFL